MRIGLIIAFLALVGLLAVGLTLNPREVPSPLIGRPAPAFELPKLAREGRFSPAEMRGKVWLFNVWASWCVSCRDEHPVLVEYARTKRTPLIGLNYKDPSDDAIKWLARYGDPYDFSVVDANGRIGIDYGVYGVPETYVIDRAGVIRYKQIGPVTPQLIAQKILPLIEELEK
ncbi:MAG: thiol:disulfide interchange protein [Betaproteobacteria bacterium RIFCSPLOWO2_02_FULL_66_14]|nr:MAG: thiol:disulfide interchange protein [Betaproteobacteria bacterium RIFCSPLOWO2_02_FULL_66_14]